MIDLPPCAGIGVRVAHYGALRSWTGPLGWCEVHSENFFADGGPALALLDHLAERTALSFHGVGLSLGSVGPLDAAHLRALDRLVQRYQPAHVSEHLCWSAHGAWHSNDLLPMPYTDEAVRHLAARVSEVQDRLGRQILVENVSCYLRFACDELSEWDFAAAVCAEAGCALLLDLNNVYVNACNHGFSATDFIAGIPLGLPREIHLAGFETTPWGLIDTHGTPVSEPVWALYEAALARFGPVPTLIERDQNLPPLADLLAEAARAEQISRAVMASVTAPPFASTAAASAAAILAS